MDDQDNEESELAVTAGEILLAALIAKDYISPAITDHKARTTAHRDVALDWLDWAVCESDRGRELAELKAKLAKKGDGTIFIGPLP